MKKNNDCISIPRDEYDELIECRIRINSVYRVLTDLHTDHIKEYGKKIFNINVKAIEIASGYVENENYFKKLQEDFNKRRIENANEVEVNTY